MTEVNGGGVVIEKYRYKNSRFKKDANKLTPQMFDRLGEKLKDLIKTPMPAGLCFEKLNGYSNPNIYSFHLTGNYKVTLEIEDGNIAVLRRVGNHDYIDRIP